MPLWMAALGGFVAIALGKQIFGGLGLDFVATGLTIYLIIGPWARPGIASTSGTEPFPEAAWLPSLGDTRFSPIAVTLAIIAVIGVWLLLRGTRFGLKLKAVGRNRYSAHLLGIPTERFILGAFAICGALAGLAGAVAAFVGFCDMFAHFGCKILHGGRVCREVGFAAEEPTRRVDRRWR